MYLGPVDDLLSRGLPGVRRASAHPDHLHHTIPSLFIYSIFIIFYKCSDHKTNIDSLEVTWNRCPIVARTMLLDISCLARADAEAVTTRTASKNDECGAAARMGAFKS